MLPYQLAGYGGFSPTMVDTLMVKFGILPDSDLSWFNFSWASRIYSAASFGVAILLAAGLGGWRKPSTRRPGKIVALVVIGLMAVFHVGLSKTGERRRNQERSRAESGQSGPSREIRYQFCGSGTACSHKRAEVIRRETDGLRELISMLGTPTGLACMEVCIVLHMIYTPMLAKRAVATPAAFLSGDGQRQSEPAPHYSLRLFKRLGREFAPLDRITAQDGSVLTGIAWRGVERLTSN